MLWDCSLPYPRLSCSPRGLIAATWYNDTSLRQVMIRHQAEEQHPNGDMHPFPPSNYPAIASADWSVQWVATMYDDFAWTNTTGRIARFWPQLVLYWKRVLSDVQADGRWTGSCLNDIRVTPNCPPGSTVCASGIVTPWIIERLDMSVTMAQAIGQTAQAAAWQQTSDTLRSTFLKTFTLPSSGNRPALLAAQAGRAPDGSWKPVGALQASHTVAVYTNLWTGADALAAMDYVFPAPDGVPPGDVQRWNNPTFLRRALKALSHVNRTQRAIHHLKERFDQYLPNSPANPVPLELQGPLGGPLPEYWISRIDEGGLAPGVIDRPQPGDGTGSHGWCGVALQWVATSLLGVYLVRS